jgi:hypothetical protein
LACRRELADAGPQRRTHSNPAALPSIAFSWCVRPRMALRTPWLVQLGTV